MFNETMCLKQDAFYQGGTRTLNSGRLCITNYPFVLADDSSSSTTCAARRVQPREGFGGHGRVRGERRVGVEDSADDETGPTDRDGEIVYTIHSVQFA